MAQPPRTCLFCGEHGSSKEDIIPLWVGEVFKQLAGPGGSVTFHHTASLAELGIVKRPKSAKKPAVHTRAFCKGCNNGWMSRLEQRTRPVLEPLLLGKEVSLSVEDQTLLAFWASKTVLAYYTQEHELTSWARAQDYTELYEAQAPLRNSQVWLGGNPNKLIAWYHAHRYPVPLHGRDPQEVHGYGASLALGHALFYVLIGYAGPVGLRLRYDAARALKEIWPARPSALKWPPTIVFPSDNPQAIPTYLAEHSVIQPQ